MYTQKELIKGAIQHMKPVARKYFVYAWLEDINWHTENRMFCEKHISDEEEKKIDGLEFLTMAIKPHAYSESFIRENIDEISKYREAYENANGGVVHMPNGAYATNSEVRDFMQAGEFQRAFSYMTGWGMKSGDWTSTSGEEFISDLSEMFTAFDVEDAEADKVREAYMRMND